MSKSRHKYRVEEEDDGVRDQKPDVNRHHQKRLDRALRTKNIDELMTIDNEGLDPIDIEDEIWADETFTSDELDAYNQANK